MFEALLLVKVVELFLFKIVILWLNNCGFGIDFVDKETGLVYDHKLICDTCNNSVTDNVYYVAVINRALCKECCDDFIKNIDRSPEDIPYEKRHYNYYAKELNLEEV